MGTEKNAANLAEPATLGQIAGLRKRGVSEKHLKGLTAAEAREIYLGRKCLPGTRKKIKVNRWGAGMVG